MSTNKRYDSCDGHVGQARRGGSSGLYGRGGHPGLSQQPVVAIAGREHGSCGRLGLVVAKGKQIFTVNCSSVFRNQSLCTRNKQELTRN